MNPDFNDPPKGAAVDLLHCSIWFRKCNQLSPSWFRQRTTRITGDKLVLQTTHMLCGKAVQVRRAIDTGLYQIYPDIITREGEPDWPLNKEFMERIHQLKRSSQGERIREFWACRDEDGSCDVCLTDYIVTVEPLQSLQARKHAREFSQVRIFLPI